MSADVLGDYLHSIGRVSLLTAEDEIMLGHRVQEMLEVRETIPEEDWTKAQKRTVKVGERAKRRMVEANLRLVVSVVKKYMYIVAKLDQEDLIQEGNFGLIRAVEKFDPRRGYKFSTYAYWWIRQAISRSITYNDRIIRIPSNATTKLRDARTFSIEYKAKHGRMPTVQEIAKATDTTVETMAHYLTHINDARSLDAKTKDSDSTSSHYIDLIPDPNSFDDENDIYEYLRDKDFTVVEAAVSRLSDKQRLAVEMTYGMNGHAPASRAEIARKIGSTRESIRQLEIRGLLNVRRMINMGKTMT